MYGFIQPDELTVTEMQVDQQVKDLNPEKDASVGSQEDLDNQVDYRGGAYDLSSTTKDLNI